jgi:hypothetical protein
MITLEANYSKKIGLPGYSSHQFSVTLKSELSDITQAEKESARLYAVLQSSVDHNIRQVGFLPGEPAKPNGNGHGNGHTPPETDAWKCSDKQRDLIRKITDEHKLDKAGVEQLAQDRFGKGVKLLNKLEASGLIEELLEQTGQSKPRNARFSQPKAGGR